MKNDERDAIDLIDLLRVGRLPEAWIAPPAVRELRELVRYPATLVGLRTGLKPQVHPVMAKNGVLPSRVGMFGPGGQAQLNALELPRAFTEPIESLRDLIGGFDHQVAILEREICQMLKHDQGYRAIQEINGVGRTIGAIFVAEIGDVHRLRSPQALCPWAGRHRSTTSPTPPCTAAGPPSRAAAWFGGRPSRRSRTPAVAPS